jgi:hypothetical protein
MMMMMMMEDHNLEDERLASITAGSIVEEHPPSPLGVFSGQPTTSYLEGLNEEASSYAR